MYWLVPSEFVRYANILLDGYRLYLAIAISLIIFIFLKYT